MSEPYKNKYRIPSARLQSWDYANEGMYFITICTANRDCYFGNIAPPNPVETRCIASPTAQPKLHVTDTKPLESEMRLSEIGKAAEIEWLKTVDLRPDMNLELAEFVVMPNHFHGIIMIGENSYNNPTGRYGNNRDAMHRVSIANTDDNTTEQSTNKFGPQSKNVASVMRGFKSAVTTYARKNDLPFAWQTRFHDHIIRSTDEYKRIVHYIVNNPVNWQNDKFYMP